MKLFLKEQNGAVIHWIIVLAVVAVIVAFYGPKTQFYAKYWSDRGSSNQEKGIYGTSSGSGGGSSTSPGTRYYVPGGVDGILNRPLIKTTPDGPYYFNFTNELSFQAISTGADNYEPTEPYTCEWEGYGNYSGTSCSPSDKAIFELGDHTIKVRICDDKGACSSSSQKFTVMQEPLASQIQRWQNYVKTGGQSGLWKYSVDNEEIYSTQNVGWTGFWNPADSNLKNYELKFKMAVKPSNDDDALGMTFRTKDLNNMYIFSVDERSMNGGVSSHASGLYKLRNGSLVRLVDLKPLKWVGDTYDQYTIRVDGNRIRIWKSDTQIVDYTDTNNPHLTGAWGPFSISQANARFKDIDLSILD